MVRDDCSKNPFCRTDLLRSERGETLLSALVSLGLVAAIFTATVASFLDSSRRSIDHESVTRAQEESKTLLDLIAFDLRMLGSGMPLGQDDFLIGDVGLGTSPLPVMVDASAGTISFRLNERGTSTVLTAEFDTTVTTSFSVFSDNDFSVGDTLYVSDMTVGGSAGLQGEVTAVGANVISIDAGFVATPGIRFKVGSVVERVALITYDSPNDWSGVVRATDNGTTITMAPNSTFSLQYVDGTGTELILPLTDAVIANNLTGIILTVNVRGEHPLKDGSVFTATAQQSIALRNLNISR